MRRSINIICDDYRNIAEGFESVHLSSISNLVDFSIDTILYYNIGYSQKAESKKNLQILSGKLRPGGSMVVKFTNLDLICKNYLDKKIKNNELIDAIKHVNTGMSIDEMFTFVNNDSLRITKIAKENNDISMVVTKVKV